VRGAGIVTGVLALALAGATAAQATPVQAHRTYGADRYVTAALQEDVVGGVRDTAYLVTGTTFADGVTAGALAGRDAGKEGANALRDNLFLTPPGQLTDDVREVIGNYRNVVVVGGEKSVGPDVMTWLQQNTRAKLSRVAGVDRYDTAAQLSQAYAPGVSTVFIATGRDYADALSASAVAGDLGVPVLTVPGDSIPASTRAALTRLKPASITVLGGEGSVSAAVAGDLAGFTSGAVQRIAGADRYATSVAVSKAFHGAGAPVAYLTSGTSWADAIAAGPAAGRRGGPLLLTPKDCVPQNVNLELERLGVGFLTAVGGDGSYSQNAALRTSCGAPAQTYLDTLGQPSGNASFVNDHAILGGTFYPRSVGYDTDPRNSEYRTWKIGTKFTRFTAVVGVDDRNTAGLTSHVLVYGDERVLGTYDVSAGHPVVVDLDVRGVDNLKVVTTSSATPATGVAGSRTVYFGDAAVR
jgi:putative cell wall-binding protein